MEVIPFISAGVLNFGDSADVARQKLASNFRTSKRSFLPTVIDGFTDLGLTLEYGEDGGLAFVEASGPSQLTFRGVRFLGKSQVSIAREMESLGFAATKGDAGLKFENAGIGLHAPSPSGLVEAVAAYRKGYYDQIPHLLELYRRQYPGK